MSSRPEPVYVDPFRFTEGVLLTDKNQHLVVDFTCKRADREQEEPYEQDVTNWITNKGRDTALGAIRFAGVEVRLFFHENGGLIGFGAIGPVLWHYPDGQSLRIWLIHFLGVHTNFRHQPGVPRNARFGCRILGGILEELSRRRSEGEPMALYVDPDNPAKELYVQF